jgi:hypothetical protein
MSYTDEAVISERYSKRIPTLTQRALIPILVLQFIKQIG